MIISIVNRLKTRKFAQELAAFNWDDLFVADDETSETTFERLLNDFQIEIVYFSDRKYAEIKFDTLKFISKENKWHAERFFDCMDYNRLELLQNTDINTNSLGAEQ